MMEAMCETYETEDNVGEEYYENGELLIEFHLIFKSFSALLLLPMPLPQPPPYPPPPRKNAVISLVCSATHFTGSIPELCGFMLIWL